MPSVCGPTLPGQGKKAISLARSSTGSVIAARMGGEGLVCSKAELERAAGGLRIGCAERGRGREVSFLPLSPFFGG